MVSASLRRSIVYRGLADSRSGQIGAALVVLVVAAALVGPAFSPYSPTEIVGVPFSAPGSGHLLGTDQLGRDVLSRFLAGGRTLLVVALLSTLLIYTTGIVIGIAVGLRSGTVDLVAVGALDVVLAFPPIIFILGILAAAGSSTLLIVLAIAITQIPRVVRIVRSVTRDIAEQEFVEAAIARGETRWSMIVREILPNIWTPVMADIGIRLTGAIILFSSIAYLGFGPSPPTADWGLMISENRLGITIQPWVIVVPAVSIALLAIGINLIADAVARAAGRSIQERGA